MWTGNLIRFPQERRTAAVEDYRKEPATILILPMVRVERCDDSEDRCRKAFKELHISFWGPLI
jgi:hypothetical protein